MTVRTRSSLFHCKIADNEPHSPRRTPKASPASAAGQLSPGVIGGCKCPLAHNDHGLFCCTLRLIAETRQCFRTRTQISVGISEIGPLADDADGAAALQVALADAGIEHRRFKPGVRSDNGDRIG